eukprot:TRINITY_DN18879_c0_g1_i2.p1 TRINITY_DN18879_c0_g1~~TRINITY_DN18879_c0_g1_i2.p1  ORF type:complete len:361 (+),score=56.24 TRINITY_DN18879_c0_g1_i2:205-1287(+)
MNFETGESKWEHPLDEVFRYKYKELKEQKLKESQKRSKGQLEKQEQYQQQQEFSMFGGYSEEDNQSCQQNLQKQLNMYTRESQNSSMNSILAASPVPVKKNNKSSEGEKGQEKSGSTSQKFSQKQKQAAGSNSMIQASMNTVIFDSNQKGGEAATKQSQTGEILLTSESINIGDYLKKKKGEGSKDQKVQGSFSVVEQKQRKFQEEKQKAFNDLSKRLRVFELNDFSNEEEQIQYYCSTLNKEDDGVRSSMKQHFNEESSVNVMKEEVSQISYLADKRSILSYMIPSQEAGAGERDGEKKYKEELQAMKKELLQEIREQGLRLQGEIMNLQEQKVQQLTEVIDKKQKTCLLYTSPSPRDS